MKKIQNQESKLVTLKHVVSRASKDEAFSSSLLKAPKATLKNNALKLSATDGKKLNSLVTKARHVKTKVSETRKLCGQLGLSFDPHQIPWADPK